MLILLAIVSTVSWVVRYRFLNMYARLPPEPQRKEPQIDLYQDVPMGDSKPGLANYLDEFLSAIKVFGYLERPVFHELTRTMQTRKLIAGEMLYLEEEKGFCLVVDGAVQIFVRSNRDEQTMNGSMFDEHDFDEEERKQNQQGYHLLTEVKNGAPLSSLFSVLSLFTEDINVRFEDETTAVQQPAPRTKSYTNPQTPRDTESSLLDGAGKQAHVKDVHLRTTMANGSLPHVPPMSLDTPDAQHPSPLPFPTSSSPLRPRPKSVHPDIVARAMVDTTIAIIPATAFKRLTQVYPKASAHIVQVILSRFQRVTLATAHSYLGLTSEVLRTETLMNRFTTYDLPNHLRGAALDRLKEKFTRERERLDPQEDDEKGLALHNPRAGRRRRKSSNTLRRDLLAQMNLTATCTHRENNATSMDLADRSSPLQRSNVNPGDLLGNVQSSYYNQGPASRLPGPRHEQSSPTKEGREITSPLGALDRQLFDSSPRLQPQRQESVEGDDVFRQSILDCMTKSIGLSNGKNASTPKTSESVEQSPRLWSYDARRQMATLSNAFGYIDPYDGSADGDSESVSASAFSVGGSTFNNRSLQEELRDDIEIVFFPKGAVLVEQGERNPGLYYVIDGFLDVGYPTPEKSGVKETLDMSANGRFSRELSPRLSRTSINRSQNRSSDVSPGKKRKDAPRESLYTIKPGGLAGYIGAVSGYRSFIDVRAKTNVYVGFLPRASLERVIDRYPVILLTMAKRLTSLLPRLILHIDFALEWVQINAGDVIHHQGDDSDAIYIVLNGRLRAIVEKDEGDMRVVGEFGQGESVGELEVLTEGTRSGTLHAMRDTEVAKFPKSLFNSLALEHPGITMKISKIIAQRMHSLVDKPLEPGKERTPAALVRSVTSVNLRTIAILPVATGVPVVEFGTKLLGALSQIGVVNGVTSLNQAAILSHLGRHAFSRMGKLKLSQYLADLEERYGMLLYIADTNVNSPWTQTCIRQADCILLVGLAEGSPAIGEFERFLLGMKTTARKELVLLHVDRYSPPGLTRKWLSNRLWINGGHHHIQMAFRMQSEPVHPQIRRFGTALKQRVQVLQAEIQKYTSRRIRQTPLYSAETPFKGDFHRLARRLCGKSVGLVLGGGGARGIAQIGVIRALEEAGIPIDIVGGTSIGAFNGALYARDGDVVPMYGRAKKFAGRMGSIWRFALDLTYPTVSYTTGHEFNRGIFKTFGDSQIEDFWLEFYCNTTNISKSRSEVHTSGYVWRYVRASMSLAGLIPPLCDEGSLLLDGGYVDNLTVAHMKSLGAETVFAVDVGALDDDTPQQFGDSLSGFWTLVNRWNIFSAHPNPPTLSEIQGRLAYVSSVDALERAKNTVGCHYMRPPVEFYGTLEFGKFDEIYEVGYKYGSEYLAALREKGVLPAMEETEEKRRLRRTMAPRRASI